MTIKFELGSVHKETGKEVAADIKFATTSEDFASDLGKAIYAVEVMGVDIKTSEIYDDAMKKFEEVKGKLKTNRYSWIYSGVVRIGVLG